jgi:hypothetical protein
MAAHQFDVIAREPEMAGQEPQERFIGGGIDGRGGHFYSELIARGCSDLVQGGAGLKLDVQQHSIRLWFQERGHAEINGSRAQISGLE